MHAMLGQMLAKAEKELNKSEDISSETIDSIAPSFSGDTVEGLKGYNAISDLKNIITSGWKMGYHVAVFTDTSASLKTMVQLKLQSLCDHKIALPMAPDNALDFMAHNRIMKSIIDKQPHNSAVYEYSGGSEREFRPYTLDY